MNMNNPANLHTDQLVIYRNGDRYEIGKIKKLTDHGAFVYYSSGDTAALTNYDDIHPIVNAHCILATSLGNPPVWGIVGGA